jgi:hypothetical protein
MKRYILIHNIHNYDFFKKDQIYKENTRISDISNPSYGICLETIRRYNPDDWKEVNPFRYGK